MSSPSFLVFICIVIFEQHLHYVDANRGPGKSDLDRLQRKFDRKIRILEISHETRINHLQHEVSTLTLELENQKHKTSDLEAQINETLSDTSNTQGKCFIFKV